MWINLTDASCWNFRLSLAVPAGTPNLSEEVRAIPNCEFHAPWFWSPGRMQKTMPHERWEELSDKGKHVCRFVKCDEGEVPPQLREANKGKL
jgi:hypothetical protein